MKERSEGRKRNLLFYAVLLIGTVGILIAFVGSQKQEERFKQENALYRAAEQDMMNAQPAEAQKKFEQLLAVNSDSYKLMWRYGLSLAAQEKYAEAETWFAKTRIQRPFIVRNQTFVTQYGEILYQQEKYEKAKRYLEEGKKLNTEPSLTQKSEPLLQDIIKKLQKS